jgi:outer membrane protein assembly factor BamB
MLKKGIPIIFLLPFVFLFHPDNDTEESSHLADFEIKSSFQYGFFEAFEVGFDSNINYVYEKVFTTEKEILFGNDYFDSMGICTFRGGAKRDRPSRGLIGKHPGKIRRQWTFKTATDTTKDYSNKSWGGGAGWTGQAAIVEWPRKMRSAFDSMYPVFKKKKAFREVIQASLAKEVYFIDLDSGKPSRPSLPTTNPIKGSVSVYPGEIPLLFVGQGIPLRGACAMMIYNLNDHRRLLYYSGRDAFAPRGWTAFDSSPLVDEENNLLIWPGENGVIYQQGIDFSEKDSNPLRNKFTYHLKSNKRYGMESSMAVCRNLGYICDNDGNLVCIELNQMKVAWSFFNTDDTDASPVVEEEFGRPVVYVGNEVDFQGDSGSCFFRKLDGIAGKLIWEKKFNCYSIRGEHPVNGGMLATPLLGKNKAKDIILISLAHYPKKYKGELIALHKKTGDILYRYRLKSFSWSSPIDLYDSEGNMYIFTACADGYVYLIDGSNGALIDSQKLNVSFDASPVAWDNKVVLAGRGNQIFCFSIE